MYNRATHYVLGWIVLCSLLPNHLQAATPVQFIDGLWLSRDSLHPNETVRVYVALRNSAAVEITGTVDIRVNDRLLGTRPITALPGRLIESWIDWTPDSVGAFTLTAILRDVTLEYPEGRESIPGHTATLTREAVTVTQPPTPPVNATSTPSEPEPNTKLPQWYQAIQQEIYDTHEQLQAHESFLENQQHPPRAQTRPTTNQATSSALDILETSLKPDSDTSSNQASVAEVVGNWLQQNLQTAQLWLIRSVRWLFGYPVVVQLLLLLGILWASYRTAQYFGRR